MQLGLVGLGRMGGNMRERLRAAGHEVVGFDHNAEVSDVASLAELAEKLAAPRVVWVMVPAGVTDATIDELAARCSSAGDLIIDGGNSRFTDDGPRAERLDEQGIGYLDVGVSGGVWGRENGYALMVGGSDEHVARLMPIFEALKPAGEFGFVHAGAGRRRALRQDGAQRHRVRPDARLRRGLRAAGRVRARHRRARGLQVAGGRAPWSAPGCSTCSTAPSTRTRSWPSLRGYAEDTGEGRWTVDEAVRLAVPMNVIAAVAVRPLRLPPGRLAGDEGGRRAASAVRRPRRHQALTPACTFAGSNWSTSAPTSGWRVELEPGPNVLVGPNGVGKTNLIEALGYVATLDSHRVATDAPLVRIGRRGGGDPLRGRPRGPGAAGRAGDRARQGQPGPARPLPGPPGPRRARRAAHGALRPRGSGAGPRRPGRAAPLPRRPAGRPASPATPGCAPTTNGWSSSATRCCARRTWRAGPAARAVVTSRPWTSGTPTWPSTAPSCSPGGWSWSRPWRRTSPRRTTRWLPGRGRRGSPTGPRSSWSRSAATGRRWKRAWRRR